MKLNWRCAIASLALSAAPLAAQNVMDLNSYSNLQAQRYPVLAGDVTDRPYRVIGHITKSIRKQTAFSKNPTFEKVQKELWERAQTMGADAVINATWGEADNISAFSFGESEARGTVIKFLTPAEVAAWKASKQ